MINFPVRRLIAKNIACFDKDYRIVEAMEKAEDSGKIMDMLEMYEDYPDRRYYDHYRYSNGRFAPKGSGTYRRGYEEPPYYHVMPREYHDYSEMENMRDMDRNRGRMYYADQHSESRYDRAKRMYTESKELHKGNTPADKDQKMKDLEGYFKEISDDITGMIVAASAEEKAMLRTKLTTLAGKV